MDHASVTWMSLLCAVDQATIWKVPTSGITFATGKQEVFMGQVTPFLTFNGQAEEAARLYVSLVKNSRIDQVHRGPGGSFTLVQFHLDGQPVTALDGGPAFQFSLGFSWSVQCDDQAEVDRLWKGLTENGGEESQCGWLKDRFGLSLQIVPKRLMELLADPDPAKTGRVYQAMLAMGRLVIADLDRAYLG